MTWLLELDLKFEHLQVRESVHWLGLRGVVLLGLQKFFRCFKGRVSNEHSSRYQRTRLADKSERGYRVNRTNGTRALNH
jgi:hypothetical protein